MHQNQSYNFRSQIATSYSRSGRLFFKVSIQNGWNDWREVLHTANTTTDPQGFIKKISPIVNIQSGGTFTTNDESEGAAVTRVAQGEYLLVDLLEF